MGFKLGSEKRQIRNSKSTPIIRKKLSEGILGEANMDGSIFIDKSIPKNSALEKRVITLGIMVLHTLERTVRSNTMVNG